LQNAFDLNTRRAEIHVHEVRPRKDHRGVDLISDALPFGRLWYVSQTQSATQSATQKCLDIFDAHLVKGVYAPQRKQSESAHWPHR
jgi:hypothetical protein